MKEKIAIKVYMCKIGRQSWIQFYPRILSCAAPFPLEMAFMFVVFVFALSYVYFTLGILTTKEREDAKNG